MPLWSISKCPNEVDRETGGYLATRWWVRWGMPRMKPCLRARRKVERDGEPKARCQLATKRAAGKDCTEKNADGDSGRDARWGGVGRGTEGTDKCHRSTSKALTPVSTREYGRQVERDNGGDHEKGGGADKTYRHTYVGIA